MEEELRRAEDGGNDEDRDVPLFQSFQVIPPELVLDKDRCDGTCQLEETVHAPRRVEREIANHVRPCVMLAHLVARGREERQQQFVLRIGCFDLLHHGTALLELAQRGGVKPDVFLALLDSFAQDAFRLPLSGCHQPRFPVEQGDEPHHPREEVH